MGFVSGHCVSTNGIVFWHDGKATWNLQSCLCNETHDESGEGQDCPGVPFGDALGQKVVYVSIDVNLFMCVEII